MTATITGQTIGRPVNALADALAQWITDVDKAAARARNGLVDECGARTEQRRTKNYGSGHRCEFVRMAPLAVAQLRDVGDFFGSTGKIEHTMSRR